MRGRIRSIAFLACGAGLWPGLNVAAASTGTSTRLSLLTSFPPEVVAAYKQAYEAANPGVVLEATTRNASELAEHLLRLPTGQRPDVVWASDPGAFADLAQRGLLQPAPSVRNPGTPVEIGRFPMDGPDGLYFGQAVSGYGLMWHDGQLRRLGLRIPSTWQDVAGPAFADQVAMCSPLRSGTTQVMVDAVLQAEGWDAGWALWAFIAGHCTAIAARSADVPADVAAGRAAVGLVVDFLALAARAGGAPVSFAYPPNTAVLPASIGVVAGGRAPAQAERFVRYALSNTGQALLYDPRIRRMPSSPFAAASMKVPPDLPNVYAVARKSPLKFDLGLYESRRALVAALFERCITRPHAELRLAVQAIHRAERDASKSADQEALKRLARARALVGQPIVNAAQSLAERSRADLALAGAERSHAWTEAARAHYLEAARLADARHQKV